MTMHDPKLILTHLIFCSLLNLICTHILCIYIVGIYIGADACLEQCTDFFSDKCKATNVNSPIYWAFNGEIITEQNRERFNVVLNPRGSDDRGRWTQTLTARNVCEPVNISCHEGREELLAHHILICKQTIYFVHVHLHNSVWHSLSNKVTSS